VTVRRIAIALLVLALPLSVGAQQNEQLYADTEGPIIADIVVEGGRTLTVDTVSYYLGLYPGDPFDPTAITEGYHRLWESGLVEDIRFEVEEVADGEVMLYVVV
jgi:outer membrane protein assembly factor BamA